MGNRQSSSATVANGDALLAGPYPSLTNTQFVLLLKFLTDEDPDGEAIRLIYAMEGPSATTLRIPPSLGHDLLLLAPILSLARSRGRPTGRTEDENANGFAHANRATESLASVAMDKTPFTEDEANCITAYLAEMSQPEQAIACLVALGLHGQLQAGRPHALNHCRRLLDCLQGALLAIVYACGGDPANFVSASRWLHRLHRMRLVLGVTMEPVVIQRARGTLTSMLPAEQSVIEMALSTATSHHRSRPMLPTTIATIMFAAREACLPAMDRYINVCHLLLGEACLHEAQTVEETDVAIGHLCTFVRGADKDALALCHSLGLASDGEGSSQYLAEQAICAVLQLPELSVSESAERRWRFIAAALLYVEDWNESFIRASLYCQLIEVLLVTGRYREAHDRLMEAWLGLQAAGKAEECTCQLVHYLLDERGQGRELPGEGRVGDTLLCSLVWNEAAVPVIDAMLGERLDAVPSPASYRLCYRWMLARANVHGAALVMYRLATEYYPSLVPCQESHQPAPSVLADRYLAMQLAVSTLSLAPPSMAWLSLPDGTILTRLQVWQHAVEAKAHAALGYIVVGEAREALLVELLQRHLVANALELFQAYVTDDAANVTVDERLAIRSLELILGFLIDSLVMGDAGEKGVLSGFFPLLSPATALAAEDDDPVELLITKCLLSPRHLSPSLVRHGLGFVIEQLLAYGYRHSTVQGRDPKDAVENAPLPAWLLARARQSLDPNHLVRILGAHHQLTLLATVLKDASLRDALTPGTRARLQLLVAD